MQVAIKFNMKHHCSPVYLLRFFQATRSITGRIAEILAESGGKRAVVVLDVFEVPSARHEIFGMPMLIRPQEQPTYVVIRSTVCAYS